MKSSDRDLGMGRPITRRDFLDGVAAVTASGMVPGCGPAEPAPGGPHALPVAELDPPLRTGMRGSHPGSFEVAHELGGVGPTEWGTTHEGDAGVYDLVFVVHMERFPKGANPAASSYDQHRAGRYEMLEESFESIERETRLQLGGILSAGGFDPARDIAAIAVNRWPHGYANWSSPLSGGGADAERAHRLALHEVPADEYDFRQMRWTQAAAIGVAVSGLVLSYLLIVFYVTPYQEARGVPMEGGRLSWRTGEALLALGWAALYVPCGFVACWMIGRSYGSAGRRR